MRLFVSKAFVVASCVAFTPGCFGGSADGAGGTGAAGFAPTAGQGGSQAGSSGSGAGTSGVAGTSGIAGTGSTAGTSPTAGTGSVVSGPLPRIYGVGIGDEQLTEFLPTRDGGFLLIGSKDANIETTGEGIDLLAVKLDSDYEVEWSRSFGVRFSDGPGPAIETDDGYVLTSYSPLRFVAGQPTVNSTVVLKLDHDGSIAWWQLFHEALKETGVIPTLLFEGADGSLHVRGCGTTPAPLGMRSRSPQMARFKARRFRATATALTTTPPPTAT